MQKYHRRLWTDSEKQIVKDMFCDNYTDEICKLLNRSYSSVHNQAAIMGLKKSAAFKKMELAKQGLRLTTTGAASRYKKGNVPENKGKPMSEHVYEKVKATMFKKGSIPHNTNYDGHERISKDGYVEIRVSAGKYVFKHRFIWEQHYGKISKEMIVVFKDGNIQNLQIENLQLISKAENMMRNTIQRFPAELKSTIRLLNKLKRKIDEK